MNAEEQVDSFHTKTRFRFDLVSMVFVGVLAVVLVFLLNTGSLAQWIADHKDTKIDEAIFFGIGLLAIVGLFALRRWLGMSRFLARYNEVAELTPEISRVKRAQQRDLFGVAIAVGVSLVLVLFFDTIVRRRFSALSGQATGTRSRNHSRYRRSNDESRCFIDRSERVLRMRPESPGPDDRTWNWVGRLTCSVLICPFFKLGQYPADMSH